MAKNGDCGLSREPHHPKRSVSRAKRLCPIMATGRTKLGRENEIAFGLAITDSSLDDSDAAARKKGPGDGVIDPALTTALLRGRSYRARSLK
jgi:hypothetical protein